MAADNDSKIIIALDFAGAASALKFAKQIDPKQCRVKVGKELFVRCGPMIIEQLKTLGFEIFLDLKFHDIPNTTARAVKAAAEMGIWMVNVHASGGRLMMEAAREAVDKLPGQKPLLIAVTVLTSLSKVDLSELGIERDPLQQVQHLAQLSQDCQLDGVVCSAQEAEPLRRVIDTNFKLVTPGIRPKGVDHNDQKRIMTPVEACRVGVDYMVIGRPITQSKDPAEMLARICAEIAGQRIED